MPTIQLHPRSLVLGLAIGASALFALAQSAPQYASTVRVQYMPHPRDMVQIDETVSFTVPAGKLLVLTALGAVRQTGGLTELQVNTVTKVSTLTDQMPYGTSTVRSLPDGLTASAGDVVSVVTTGGTWNGPFARAWGYLADQ